LPFAIFAIDVSFHTPIAAAADRHAHILLLLLMLMIDSLYFDLMMIFSLFSLLYFIAMSLR